MLSIAHYFTNADASVPNALADRDSITVYTDGACVLNGKRNAYGGIGIYCENTGAQYSQKLTYQSFAAPVTNNVCEMYAIAVAIDRYAKTGVSLTVVTDSQYCYNVFTKWAAGWKAKGWTKADKKPIQNLPLIQNIHAKTLRYSISFRHCNSHRIEPQNRSTLAYRTWYGNDQADKLASAAMHS